MQAPIIQEKNNKEHLASLDIIRGIAILMVFFYHCMFWSHGTNKIPWDGWHRDLQQSIDLLILIPITWGHAGVAVFFVVSGFCIHLSHSRSAGSCSQIEKGGIWFRFVMRRLWRILPPYLVALALFVIGDVVTGQLTDKFTIIKQVWTHLFLVHNFFETTHFGINPSFWSIAVEAQLYWIYPLFYYLNRNHGWGKAMMVTFVIEMTIRLGMAFQMFPSTDTFRFISHGPLAYWFSWTMGAWIAEAWTKRESLFFDRFPFSLAFTIFIATWFFHPLDAFFFPAASLATAVLLAQTIKKQEAPPPRAKHAVCSALGFIGSISYSLYLFHQPLISLWNKLSTKFIGSPEPIWLFFVLCASIVPITILSWISYRWIECPGIAAGKHFIDRSRLRRTPL
jgi:peptidoglycan/LPS O-acetylase OafA/YrhL